VPYRQVGIHPEASFLHVAVGHLDILEQLLQRDQVESSFSRRTQVGLTHDLGQRDAGAVEVDRAHARDAVMKRLPGIFLQVEPGDSN
jgi:hypothetical protein